MPVDPTYEAVKFPLLAWIFKANRETYDGDRDQDRGYE
jgi:hypothetical protein